MFGEADDLFDKNDDLIDEDVDLIDISSFHFAMLDRYLC